MALVGLVLITTKGIIAVHDIAAVTTKNDGRTPKHRENAAIRTTDSGRHQALLLQKHKQQGHTTDTSQSFRLRTDRHPTHQDPKEQVKLKTDFKTELY